MIFGRWIPFIVRMPIEWRNNLCVPWRNDFYIPRLAIDINLNSNGCASAAKARRRVHPMVCGPVYPPLFVVRPYLLFPSIPPRENRVEMALNYTDPIEFTTQPSGATCANATTVFFDGHSLYSSFPCFFPLPVLRIPTVFILVFEREEGILTGIKVFHGKLEIENCPLIRWFSSFYFFFFFSIFVILPSLMCYWKFL